MPYSGQTQRCCEYCKRCHAANAPLSHPGLSTRTLMHATSIYVIKSMHVASRFVNMNVAAIRKSSVGRVGSTRRPAVSDCRPTLRVGVRLPSSPLLRYIHPGYNLMKPKIIKNAKEHEAALARIEKLMDARRGTPEADELELLATLVEMYEDEAYPIDEPDPVEAIRFRMEQQGLRPRDLVPYIGSRSKVSEILSGHRTLSLRMIRGLSAGLGIPAAVLVHEPQAIYKSKPARRRK